MADDTSSDDSPVLRRALNNSEESKSRIKTESGVIDEDGDENVKTETIFVSDNEGVIDSTSRHVSKPSTSHQDESAASSSGGAALPNSIPECAVCLQTCVHPARLPCSHIFCFLCLKGIAHGSRACAMCRQPIPPDYLDHPDLVQIPSPEDSLHTPLQQDSYTWFYEGRNGWWQYDWRTSTELESAFRRGDTTTEVLIAGYVYVISLSDMIQMRKSDPNRRRNIKRDLESCVKKGIAGLRTNLQNPSASSSVTSSAVQSESDTNALSQAVAKLNLNQV